MKFNKDEKKRPSFLSNKSFIDNFNNAINGLIGAVRSEKNIKVHLAAAIIVAILTLILDFTKVELAILSICVVMVFVTEFINTAIEEIVDLQTQGRYSKVAKVVKDIAAGAVFVTAINAVLVGYLLIYDKIRDIFLGKPLNLGKIYKSPSHLIFISLVLVLISVLILKALFFKKKTTHLQGGTVSGHTAIAFNLAVIATILAKDFEVSVVVLLLAALVAESRVEAKIHTLREVVFGAILGSVIPLLLFINYY